MRVRGDEQHALVVWFAGHAAGPMWHVASDGRPRALNRLARLMDDAHLAQLARAHDLGPDYEVFDAPESMGGGVLVVSRVAQSYFERALREAGELWSLTPRQREVLRELCEGCRAEEIAEKLGMKWNTARVHCTALLRKSGCASAVEMVGKLLKMEE